MRTFRPFKAAVQLLNNHWFQTADLSEFRDGLASEHPNLLLLELR